MKLAKGNVKIGIHTRFGPNWPGIRYLAKIRRGTACQRATYKHNGRCALHGGLSTGPRNQEGAQRVSEASCSVPASFGSGLRWIDLARMSRFCRCIRKVSVR